MLKDEYCKYTFSAALKKKIIVVFDSVDIFSVIIEKKIPREFNIYIEQIFVSRHFFKAYINALHISKIKNFFRNKSE